MPILAAEACQFPVDLFSEVFDRAESWCSWAVYTKPRQEKALARELCRRCIPFYLPVVAQDRIIREARVPSFIPLFSSYIFIFPTEEERTECLKTNRTCQWLKADHGEPLLADLAQLQQLIKSGAPLTLEARLAPGHRMRIRHGALAGLEGTIIQRRGRSRLLVAVQMIQQGVSVEIDDIMVESID